MLEVLAKILGIKMDFSALDYVNAHIEMVIEEIYDKFPQEKIEKTLDIQPPGKFVVQGCCR